MERLSRRISLPFVAILFFDLVTAYAGTVDKDLEGIKRKIEKERHGISEVKKQEGSVLQALGKIEREYDKKARELKTANSKLASILAEMRKKEIAAQKLRSTVDQRRGLLKKRAVALYRWHRGGSPFMMLNGDVSPGDLMQRRRYLEAAVSFDQELVHKLSDEAAYQESIKAELARKREQVDEQRNLLSEIQDSVRKEGEKKKQLLASLRQEKESRTRTLKELEQAALRLQKMMDEIARRSLGKSGDKPSGSGFDRMRGKLEWPVRGEIKGEFGKTRHPEFSAEVFRKGIDIEAPIGEEIKAVERGKVVFADRFSGYGKMMILEHGDRYFSIYAHLSEILKKSGEIVNRGEILGLVGDSDSLAGARLYFEMRKDGKSIDPLPWFRK
jgi:septal ring factor EnvC (AmiA/AmiB activator)